jgi:hypothetical protein
MPNSGTIFRPVFDSGLRQVIEMDAQIRAGAEALHYMLWIATCIRERSQRAAFRSLIHSSLPPD